MGVDAPPRLLPLGLALLGLAGCASNLYEGKYDWGQGWRKARVVAVQTAAEMKRPRFYDCVRNASPDRLTTERFAVLEYREMARTRRSAAPLQAGDRRAAGDVVYFKPGDCGTPIVAASRQPAS